MSCLCYSYFRLGGLYWQPSSKRCRAITNDWRISMTRSIAGNCATIGSDNDLSYDRLLRPTTDRTINRRVRRPIVRTIVTPGHRWYDQSLHLATDRTNNRGILWPSVRKIVAPDDRWYDQSWGPRSSTTGGATMHDWWYDHVRHICVRLWFGIAG